MSGQNNSLMDYRNEISAATNKGWPLIPQNQDFTGHPNKQYTINVGTVLNGQNTPQINWNSPLVPDSILSSNGLIGTTTSSSSTDSGMNGWTIAGLAISALGVAGSIAAPIISLIKSKKDGNTQGSEFSKAERKEIAQNTPEHEDYVSNLNSCIQTAEGIDKNTDDTTAGAALQNLTHAISAAQGIKDEAVRKIETANTTITNAKKELLTAETERDRLSNSITEKGKKLNDLKKQLNDDNLSDEDKNTIKTQIEALEKEIKKLERQKETYEENIANLNAKIEVQQQIVDNNTQIRDTIETRITAGRGAVAKITTAHPGLAA